MWAKLAPAAALAIALSAGSASATTYTLDFSGNICGDGTEACGNGSEISQGYGDVAGQVDVIYDSNTTVGDEGSDASRMFHWGPSYSDLTSVAYGGVGVPVSIFLRPLAAGLIITLDTFSLGAWPNTNRDTSYSVLDGLGNLLTSSGPITVLGATASIFGNPGTWSSADGIRIVFGPDAFNVGIDNIQFTVTGDGGGGGPTPIPLPASALLLIAGLGGLAALRRRA